MNLKLKIRTTSWKWNKNKKFNILDHYLEIEIVD